MKKKIIVYLSLFISCAAFAGIQGEADALLRKLDPNAYIGAKVVDLTTGANLYERAPNNAFIPASNMKLFSDAAALLVLGPDYRFTNQLSTNAQRMQQGELVGALYLTLSGDPSFSHLRLERMFSELKKWQIKKIHGNIIVDSSHSPVSPSAPGWASKDLAYSYGAPLGPVMVDANRLTITVNPGAQVDSPAIIEVNDPSGSIQISNQVITKASSTGCGVGMTLDKTHHLLVKGCIAKGQWALQQGLAIQNPYLYLEGIVKKQLREMNIVLEGEVVLGQTPSGSLLLVSDASKPISQLLSDTLKPSDNLYADSLFLHAAAILNGGPVNWEQAQPLIKNFLQEQTGLDLKSAQLIDGSGLSRFDRLTPSQTVGLLQFLYQKFPLAYEYIAALPVSGRDGTLERRLKSPTQQDFIRAKTGTMTGVNSLSGYIYTANGHTLAFALFSNRRPKVNPKVSGRVLIDTMCNYFLKQEPGNISWAKFFTAHKRLSYQQHLTQAEKQHIHRTKWRRLEAVVKGALRDQPVSVVYRPNELIVMDNQQDPSVVYKILQLVAQKYPFALAVSAPQLPVLNATTPLVLQMDTMDQNTGHQRLWTIREAV